MSKMKTKPAAPVIPPTKEPPFIATVFGGDELSLKIEITAINQCLRILYIRESEETAKGNDPKKLDILWDSIGRLTSYKQGVEEQLAKFDPEVKAPRLSRLDRLQEELQTAIGLQEYELCAKLRDEIKSIS